MRQGKILTSLSSEARHLPLAGPKLGLVWVDLQTNGWVDLAPNLPSYQAAYLLT